jgi:hypothetical protein
MDQVDTAARLWAKHLDDIEDEHVNRAMESCVYKFAWAPDVAEFKKLCMAYKGSSRTPWVEEVLKFEKPKVQHYNNQQINTLIVEGAEICKRLKKIYPEKTWMTIASVFTQLKNKARPFYPGMTDINLIRELYKYSDQDMIDALG